MSSGARRDWRTIVLLIGGGGSGLFAVAVALSLAAYAWLDAWGGRPTTSASAQMGIGVVLGALVLMGGILIIAAYHALMAFRAKAAPPVAHTPLRLPTIIVLILVWLASSILAQAVVHAGGPPWLASPLHLLAIGAPVYLLARLATTGLPGGTPVRMWGAVAAGLVLGTGISALAESALALAGVSAAGVFLVLNPNFLLAAQGLLSDIGGTSTVEDALVVLQPILVHPLALVAILAAVSVVIPIVEEVAKSAAAWLIYRRLRTAAEGFWCGVLSGAGFALFEGLMASADTSGNWTVIFLIRAWSSMMHILASGLAGWGIAAFRLTGRGSRLLGGYALAIGIHALWNASVVGIGYGGLRSVFLQAGPDVIAGAAIAAGALTLLGLAVMLPAAILLINRALRTSRTYGEKGRVLPNTSALPSPHLKV